MTPTRALSDANSLLYEWKEAIGYRIQMRACGNWHLPAQGRVKLSIHVAQFVGAMTTGLGMVIRDDLGSFMVARTVCFPGNLRADEAKVIGLYEALSWNKNLTMDNIEVEMDVKVVVDAFNSGI
ncbi:hypothetical protein ACS0TY_034779 [Phlomoides rotata]